jgi:hypothetical protein
MMVLPDYYLKSVVLYNLLNTEPFFCQRSLLGDLLGYNKISSGVECRKIAEPQATLPRESACLFQWVLSTAANKIKNNG